LAIDSDSGARGDWAQNVQTWLRPSRSALVHTVRIDDVAGSPQTMPSAIGIGRNPGTLMYTGLCPVCVDHLFPCLLVPAFIRALHFQSAFLIYGVPAPEAACLQQASDWLSDFSVLASSVSRQLLETRTAASALTALILHDARVLAGCR
jgi:hypothetical protein